MDYIKILRIKHWIKNLFVFAGIVFSLNLFDFSLVVKNVYTFFSFSLASSFIYIINDLFDRKKDRMHPLKKNRPIASGNISPLFAVFYSLIPLIASLILGYFVNISVLIIILLYVVINFFYSFNFKHIVILDVMIIAIGFVLRVLAGIYATEVEASSWILLTTLVVSMFLGFGKRRSEIQQLEEVYHHHRPVLMHYSIQLLDYMIIVSITLSIITYSLYTIDDATIIKFGSNNLMYSVPFVIFGLFRYMYLIFKKNGGSDPADIVIKDKYIIVSVVLWFITILFILYHDFILSFF